MKDKMCGKPDWFARMNERLESGFAAPSNHDGSICEPGWFAMHILTAEKVVAQANIPSGRGRRRCFIEKRLFAAKDGAGEMPEHRRFLEPQGAFERLFERVFHHEFGFQLENLRGFFRASAVVARFLAVFIAAGRSLFSGFGAAIFGRGLRSRCASVAGGKNRNGRLPQAVAINLPDADADGGSQQRGHPKPGKCFFRAGRHFNTVFCKYKGIFSK